MFPAKHSRELSITVYGAIVTIVGFVLYMILTMLATDELDNLQAGYEEKHKESAKVELMSATAELSKVTDYLVDEFQNWEELLQQLNDPTYYSYWQENRVAFANFVPTYFRKLSLYGKDRMSLMGSDGERSIRKFGNEINQIIIRKNGEIPVIERCMTLNEAYGAKKILGYFCFELDLYKGLKSVQTFNYLDINSITVKGIEAGNIPLTDLNNNINFSVLSEQTLSKMHDLTVDTIFRYLVVSASVILIFLYILVVPLGRPLRGLSNHINALEVFGSDNSFVPMPGLFKITELDTVYNSLNNYQVRLEKSAEELKHSEEYFRSLIENSSDIIVSLDNKGMIIYISPSVDAVLGYEKQEIIGDHLFEYIHGNDIEFIRTSLSARDNALDALSHYDFRFKNKNGDWLTLELAGKIFSEDGTSSTIVCRDITERKRVQEAISRAHDKALEASSAKSNFLANTSHELRTPLNAILGYTEMVREDLKENNFEQIDNDISKVHVAAKNLLNLIDEVLDLSKIESGKMDVLVEEFSVRTLLDEIERTITPLMMKNSNHFEANIIGMVKEMSTDRNKLRQIIFNLLNNAAKFTHEGSVELKVSGRKEKGREWIDFVVTDTGIGMNDEQQGKIFEPFAQADSSTTRQYGGTGLGLAICRNFAHLLNGDIVVHSKEGVGSTFTLSLPARIRKASERFFTRQAS